MHPSLKTPPYLAAAYNGLCRRKLKLHGRCESHPDFKDWKCCSQHRRLSDDYDALRQRAQEDHAHHIYLPLSPAWWQTIGYIWVSGSTDTPDKVEKIKSL
jgi:hypothetical protein